MLRQDDFVNMLASMLSHVERTINITDELVVEMKDRDLRFKLVALRQAKYSHLETLEALSTLLKENMAAAPEQRKAPGG